MLEFVTLFVWGCAVKSTSQSGEENIFISRFMSNRTNGTFVEIGAFDGHTYSNTRVLNFCYGWNGLLIEANLRNYVSLIEKFDRVNVQVMHSAVCEASQNFVPFTVQGGPVATDITRVSSSFQKRWAKTNRPEKTLHIPCKPMKDLLAGYSHIHFFSLDVEGAEYTVVNTIDFDKVTIDTFCIEFDDHNPPKNHNVTSLLKQQGYTRCSVPDKRNAWFRKSC